MGGVQKKQRIGSSKTCVWDAISVHGLPAGERSPLPNKAHEARSTEPSHAFPVDLDVLDDGTAGLPATLDGGARLAGEW